MNIISRSVEGQLKRPIGYHFYKINNENFQNFLQEDIVINYKNLLAEHFYGTEGLNTNWEEKEQENLRIMTLAMLSDLIKREQDMITTFKNHVIEGNNNIVVNFPAPKNLIDKDGLLINSSDMESYYNTFNHYLQSIFVDSTLRKNNDKIQWKNFDKDLRNKEKLDYNDFLYMLASISREGGFDVRLNQIKFSGNSVQDIKNFMKSFHDSIESNGASMRVKAKAADAFSTYLSHLDLAKNKISKASNLEQELYESLNEYWKGVRKTDIIGDKNFMELEKNLFMTIVVPPFVKAIKTGIMNKGKQKDFKYAELLLKMESLNFWELFYIDLKKAHFSIFSDVTFLTQRDPKDKSTLNGIVGTMLKGDFGEMVQAVLSVHRGFDTKYMGATSSNEIITTQQSVTDTLISVNGKKYGIQDKELRFTKDGGINVHLYKEKKQKINFSDSSNILLRYFSNYNIYKLAALVELYSGSQMDNARFNALFSHLSYERLRIVDYSGIENAEANAIKQDNIVHNLIYRITGYYFPASYILYKRFLAIQDEAAKRTQHYQLDNIDTERRDANLMNEVLHDTHGNVRLPQLQRLNFEQAENFVKAITLRAW